MLTDDELNQMLADAAEMQRLRDAATRGPWVEHYESYDKGDRLVAITDDDPSVEPDIEDVLFGPKSAENWRFIIESRTDKSAEHVERLVQEVQRLRSRLRCLVSHPTQWPAFHSQQQLDEVLTLQYRRMEAYNCIDACHIHGVEVPPHLKPYEEAANG